MMKYGSYLLTIFIFIATFSIEAANIQELDALKAATIRYANQQISLKSTEQRRTEVSVSNLDPRLRLTQCGTEIIFFMPPGSRLQGHTTIGARCTSPRPWSIYIPVKIAIFEQAIIAVTRLNRGQIISKSDIIIDEVDVSRLRGNPFKSIADVIGTKLKTTIKENQVIDSTAVCLICKGDSVVISSTSSSVSVTVAGIALNDGGKGDKIRVQNSASRRIIDAIVTNVGAVSVEI